MHLTIELVTSLNLNHVLGSHDSPFVKRGYKHLGISDCISNAAIVIYAFSVSVAFNSDLSFKLLNEFAC